MNKAARTLRRNQSEAERKLWHHLRDRRLDGWKFRRQHPVGPYVLDLYCTDANLVIEIDGGQHDDDEHRQHDEKRTAYLVSQGLKVMRFWNNEVMENTLGVLETIREALGPSPQPSPRTRGEGEGRRA
ncbi:MAG: endonuclease domain-containing protein [Rhodocyclaceae bacterium]|nr:endonuclease domain-containing protein [Rhodocyclaceae bacterium]